MLEVRYRLWGTTWEELLARLAALRYRAAIVGPHGRGKTTLLEDLAPRLEALGLRTRSLTIHEAHPQLDAADRALLRRLGPGEVLLLDGAEGLGALAWWRVRRWTRRAGGLVITSHRPGLLPTLIECETTPALLAELVREILGSEAQVSAEELFARHGGNVRNALRELYDVYATSPPGPLSHLPPAPPPGEGEKNA